MQHASKLAQTSFAEMVLKGMASAQAEPCHQRRPKIGASTPRLLSNLERMPQRLKAGFQAGFNGTATLR